MQGMQKKATTIDEFIAGYPPEAQAIMQKMRAIIREEVPQAIEKISYGIPTFDLHGNLVHFSAYKSHIGFYPGAEGIEVFKNELSNYPTSKGTVQFPLDQPIPYDLVRRITQFRVKANLAKAASKKK